jgi:2-polyprenyl-3-methyl-5-hydroxy-6-metoxy-1,4-benzoquinol methylase
MEPVRKGDPSREAAVWSETKASLGTDEITLGSYFTFIIRNSPRRLLHLLSYYKFAAKMIGPGRRVVDIGCSEGLGTVLLAENASDCVGVDLDAEAIAVANASVATANLRFVCADVLGGGLGRFGAAVSLDVIEHIFADNEDPFVAGVARALDDDGIFIIGTPNVAAETYASPQSRRGHVNMFDAVRLRDLGLRHFHNVFSFSANDEIVHTGFSPMAHYLLALCVGPRRSQ